MHNSRRDRGRVGRRSGRSLGGKFTPKLVAARDGHKGIDTEEVVVDRGDDEAVP